MLLFPEDLKKLTLYFQGLGDFDQELIDHCREPLERSDYSDVVKTAFLVLEKKIKERVKALADVKGLHGRESAVQLIIRAFGEDGTGPLAKKMYLDQKEAKDLLSLYRGAFGVFRNPVAHDLDATYDPEQTRIVLLLVNMLLRQLKAIDSPETHLKLLFVKQGVSSQIQSLVREILSQLGKSIPDLNINIGETQIGINSSQRSFTSLIPRKKRLEIQYFSRGSVVPGTKVVNKKIAPRWGKFTIGSMDELSKTLSILMESQARLMVAMAAKEPTGIYTGGLKPGSSRKQIENANS